MASPRQRPHLFPRPLRLLSLTTLLLMTMTMTMHVHFTQGTQTRWCHFLTARRGYHQRNKCGGLLIDTLELVCKMVSDGRVKPNPIDFTEDGGGREDDVKDRNRVETTTRMTTTTTTTEKAEGPVKDSMCSDSGPKKCFENGKLAKREAMSYLIRSPLSKKGRLDYAKRGLKGRGFSGIVCECCFHRCSLSELAGYCGL